MNSSISKNNSAAIIPFFNEAATIEKVVAKTLKYVNYVICVDDGSTDNSVERIANYNVKIIRHKENIGKGGALRTGFEYVLKNNFDPIVALDADMQHDPDYIPKFLDAINRFDVVIGNRLNDLQNMPKQRILSNKITSKLLSFKLGTEILDSQCGYRAYKRDILESILTEENGFEAESMMIIKAARKGLSIGFVDIPTVYGNDSSKMRNFEATIGFIKVLLS